MSRAGSCRSLPSAAFRFGGAAGRIRGTGETFHFPVPHHPQKREKTQQLTEQRSGRGTKENPKAEAASTVRLREAAAAVGSALRFWVLRSELGFLLPSWAR